MSVQYLKVFALFLSTFLSSLYSKGQDYIVQLAIFQETVSPNYFKFSKTENVKVFIDANSFNRYYIGPFKTEEEAKSIKKTMKFKGFKYSKILNRQEQFDLCGNNCWFIKNDSLQNLITHKIKARNIYFNYNDIRLNIKPEEILRQFLVMLNDNRKFDLNVYAYADSKGSAAYNLLLSKKRARTVRNYLMKNGISENRLQIKIFGESNPIAMNKNSKGEDEPIGRQFNRRVMLQIVPNNSLAVSELEVEEIPNHLKINGGKKQLPVIHAQVKN